jgi:hypothetical protein
LILRTIKEMMLQETGMLERIAAQSCPRLQCPLHNHHLVAVPICWEEAMIPMEGMTTRGVMTQMIQAIAQMPPMRANLRTLNGWGQATFLDPKRERDGQNVQEIF